MPAFSRAAARMAFSPLPAGFGGRGWWGASFTSFTRGSHEVARGKTLLPDRLVSRSLLYTRV